MPVVTVQGANHSTISLLYDLDANAVLARYVAAEIKTGLDNGTVLAWDNSSGPPPPLPPNKLGEFVQSKSGTTFLPAGYDYVVDSAKSANIFGNGDAGQRVLAGASNLSFSVAAGSGSVIAGGGDNNITIQSSDPGNWLIALGNGDDFVRALGSGTDTINLGSDETNVQLLISQHYT